MPRLDDNVGQITVKQILQGCFEDVLVASQGNKEDGQVNKQIPSVAGTSDVTLRFESMIVRIAKGEDL